jgi:hypothetical protein
MILSLYEQAAARVWEYQVRNTPGVSSNERLEVTEKYFEDDSEIFIKYDLELLGGLG